MSDVLLLGLQNDPENRPFSAPFSALGENHPTIGLNGHRLSRRHDHIGRQAQRVPEPPQGRFRAIEKALGSFTKGPHSSLACKAGLLLDRRRRHTVGMSYR